MNGLTVCGDVHGKVAEFQMLAAGFIRPSTIRGYDVSTGQRIRVNANGSPSKIVQLGDWGFFNQWEFSQRLDKSQVRILPGNHDDYDVCRSYPCCLSDYGSLEDFISEGKRVFYARGAWSIDWRYRTLGRDLWTDEEIPEAQWDDVLTAYSACKPSVVLSHDCPSMINRIFHGQAAIETRTGTLLQKMYDIHQPKFWMFGHHHRSWAKKVGDTVFCCANELELIHLVNIV